VVVPHVMGAVHVLENQSKHNTTTIYAPPELLMSDSQQTHSNGMFVRIHIIKYVVKLDLQVGLQGRLVAHTLGSDDFSQLLSMSVWPQHRGIAFPQELRSDAHIHTHKGITLRHSHSNIIIRGMIPASTS